MAINIIYKTNTEELNSSSVFIKEDFKFSFKTLLKLYNTEGNLAYEYNPFRNFRSKYDLYKSDALGNLVDEYNNKIFWIDGNYYLTKNNIKEFIEIILPSKNISTANLNSDQITIILKDVTKVNYPVFVLQRANSLLDFETNLLDLSIKNSLQIECQPSYDGSVNLILNDNKNPPRLINSRFTVLQNDTYKVVDRKGDNDTNIYDDKSFNNDISLYKRINSIPKIDFLGLKYGGNFSVGNFVFYFKYCDADGNETDFLEESGIVTTHIGNINSPSSIRSGIANENSRKMVEFNISNIDQNYDFLKVYYTRSYSDETSGELTDAFVIDRNFPIKGKSLNLILTGYDKIIPVTIQTINAQYTIANSAKTQCQVQNRLFMANIYKPSINYKDLEDLSLRIFPNARKVSKIGKLDEYYTDLSLKYEYYNAKNIYYNLGIWDKEIYRFGIVYIMKDYTLSPVFNTRGRNGLKVMYDHYDNTYIEDNFLNKPVYDGEKRAYLEINEDTFEVAGSTYDMDNSKGVTRFIDEVTTKELTETEPIGVQFIIPEDVVSELRKNTLGYFIVRQKRIPTVLAQAFTMGWDKESYLPSVKAKLYNSTNSNFIIESFMNSSRDLTHDFSSRIRNLPINSSSKIKAVTAICPEFELKQPYFNELFTGESFPISEASIQPENDYVKSTLGLPRHFYSQKYFYKQNNSGIIQNIKIVSVADDTKLKTSGSNKFSARAGEAEEAFRYSQIGNENNSTDNANIVRGSFGPFLGIEGYQSTGKIINIHIPGYSLDRMNEYFRIRYEDNSPYFAISNRELFNDMVIGSNGEYTTDILYRGDCFIGNYTHRMCRNFQDPEVPVNDSIVQPNTWKDNFKYGDPASYSKINRADVNAVQIGHWVTIRYMSNTNLSMRNTDNSRPSEEALFGSPRSFFPLYGFSTNSETKMPESFVVNSGHSSTTSDRYNFIIPDVPYLKNEYDARILFSDIHVNDSFKNGFRVFNTANYVDYPRIYGGITKIVPFRNNIIVVFEHGVALVPVNERAQVSDASGGPVYLTSPEDRVLPANFQILDPNFGSSWIDSIIVTPQAVFGVDTVAKKIWQTDGEKFSTISDFKFQKFLNDNISLKERENEMILGVRNVKTHYNNFKKDVIFTFYDDLYGTQETVWSLCYNLISESFITFYSWVPSFMANINNMPFSFDRNVSKLISKLSLSNINSKDADGIVLTSNIITKNSTKIGNLDLINRSFAFPKNVIVKKQFVLLKDNWNNYSNFVIKYNSGIYELHYKDSVQYETIKALNTSSILLNIECKVSLENYDVNDPDTAYYLNNFKDYYTVNYGQLENTIAVIAEENLLNTETYFWKHGQAGQFDIADDILPTVWYGKQHPFEFEFIVADKPSYQKIFDNLQILSNKAEPESFHYEIVGESYDFSEDKKNMYFRQEATNELFQNLGSDISYNKNYKRLVPEKLVKSNYLSLYYKREDSLNEIYDFYKTATSQGKDYSNLTGSEIVYDKLMNEFRISVHSKAQDIQKYGRSRGNMQYKEDLWAIEIAPLAFNTKNETWAEPFITNNFSGKEAIKVPPIILNYLPEDSTQYVIFPEDLPNNVGCSKCSKVFTYGFNDLVTNTSSWSTLKEAKIRDKYIKIRIRYSGKDLAVISNIITSYTISYS